MYELLNGLVSRMIQLLTIRERRRARRYERIWAPTFAGLETVHGDYLKMINDVRAIVKRKFTDADTETPRDAAINLVKERRIALAPVRVKIGQLANLSHDDHITEPFLESERTVLYAIRNYLFAGSLEEGPGASMSQATGLLEEMQKTPPDVWVSADVVSYIGEFGDRLERNWGRVADAYFRLELDLIERGAQQ